MMWNEKDNPSQLYSKSSDWHKKVNSISWGTVPILKQYEYKFKSNNRFKDYQRELNEFQKKQSVFQLAHSLPIIRYWISVMIETGWGEVARPLLSILDMIEHVLIEYIDEEYNKIPWDEDTSHPF